MIWNTNRSWFQISRNTGGVEVVGGPLGSTRVYQGLPATLTWRRTSNILNRDLDPSGSLWRVDMKGPDGPLSRSLEGPQAGLGLCGSDPGFIWLLSRRFALPREVWQAVCAFIQLELLHVRPVSPGGPGVIQQSGLWWSSDVLKTDQL